MTQLFKPVSKRAPCRVCSGTDGKRNVIVDGMNRYPIAKEHGLSFRVESVRIGDTYEEAEEWIWNHQAGRRNLSREAIGKWYNRAKTKRGGDHAQPPKSADQSPNRTLLDTAEHIAEKTGTSATAVKRAGKRAETLQKCAPAVQKAVETGTLKASDADLVTLSKLPKGDQNAVVTAIRKGRAMWLACYTHAEIAEAVGVSRVAVTEQLQELSKTETLPKATQSAISHETDVPTYRGTVTSYVFRANFMRRNLSASQKKEALKAMKKVANALREGGHTQARVGRLLGVDRSTVSKWFEKPPKGSGSNVKGHNTSATPGGPAKPDSRTKINAAQKPERDCGSGGVGRTHCARVRAEKRGIGITSEIAHFCNSARDRRSHVPRGRPD